MEADDDEKAILADIGLLSAKPVIYACNMSEDDFASNIEITRDIKPSVK